MLKVIFLVEGELSFAFFCPFGYIPHPLDAPLGNGEPPILASGISVFWAMRSPNSTANALL
jgi:hypothetical protein